MVVELPNFGRLRNDEECFRDVSIPIPVYFLRRVLDLLKMKGWTVLLSEDGGLGCN